MLTLAVTEKHCNWVTVDSNGNRSSNKVNRELKTNVQKKAKICRSCISIERGKEKSAIVWAGNEAEIHP